MFQGNRSYLTKDDLGNIPIKELVKPLRPPCSASGKIATSHYNEIFTVDFQVFLYENLTGHLVLKYEIPRGAMTYRFEETFRMRGQAFGPDGTHIVWLFICKCKRKTRHLLMGRDYALGCANCLPAMSRQNRKRDRQAEKLAKNPALLRKFIRSAHTPTLKRRALNAYIDFLKRMVKAIRSNKAYAFVKDFKP